MRNEEFSLYLNIKNFAIISRLKKRYPYRYHRHLGRHFRALKKDIKS